MEQLLTADPSHPAIIMAQSGETITHGQLEARANKIARLLRTVGLKRGDHCAVFMENHPRYIECGFAAERAGLYYTNVNSYLTAASSPISSTTACLRSSSRRSRILRLRAKPCATAPA